MWAGLGVGTWIVSRLSPANIPLGILLVAGALVGVAVTRPVHAAYQTLFVPLTRDPDQVTLLPVLPATMSDWGLLFSGNAMLMLFWVGGGVFFARFVGYAPVGGVRARVTPATLASPVEPPRLPPRFAARLTRLPAISVEVIRADDHYTCAIAAEGEELVLYRFADAAAELQNAGWIRVHRSYCVRRDRIAKTGRRGRSLDVFMQGGMIVPVSERHRGLVEQVGK